MKNILIIGAGLSSTDLIQYLLKQSDKYNWKITLGDMSLQTAQKKIGLHPNGTALRFNLKDLEQRASEIRERWENFENGLSEQQKQNILDYMNNQWNFPPTTDPVN